MGTYTVNSWSYYSIGTVIATGDTVWIKQAQSGSNPGYSPSSYAEVGPGDNSLTPNEILDPDYSAQNATYLGTYTFNGNVFVVLQDEFGQLLGSVDMNVPYADFPGQFDPDTIDATVTVFCFLAGTLIDTPSAAALVENLNIGDEIISAEGRAVQVKWIGRQTVTTLFAGPHMQPVRIRAGALGAGLPHSDLTVTADHGMVIDGLVINASALVNGTTIDWVPLAALPDRVTYYHIETENHDVILANGAPAETFVDYADRRAFDNHQEYVDLYGAERIIPEMDRPRISSRRLLPDAIKARLRIDDAGEQMFDQLSA